MGYKKIIEKNNVINIRTMKLFIFVENDFLSNGYQATSAPIKNCHNRQGSIKKLVFGDIDKTMNESIKDIKKHNRVRFNFFLKNFSKNGAIK